MAVLAYFSHGISAFSLKNCGITILKIMRYTVFAILDSKTAVIDKICLRYYGIEYPPMPSSTYENIPIIHASGKYVTLAMKPRFRFN
jgi:hypothetical protein